MKDIQGYEGLYCITEDGKVWSKRKNIFLKYWIDCCGYPTSSTKLSGKMIHFRLHREVAKAYIPNPMNLEYVNHIDGDKTNPNVSNLEWCTPSENMKHAYRTNLSKSQVGSNRRSLLSDNDVRFIKANCDLGANVLSEKLNVPLKTVKNVLCGRHYKDVI